VTVGTFANNQYWDGTTTLTGDITIPQGKILRLAAGAVVNVPFGNKLIINGTLQNEGTEAQPVIMQSSSSTPAAGDWDGLYINGPQQLSHIQLAHTTSGINLGSHSITLSDIQVVDSLTNAITGLTADNISITNAVIARIGATAIRLRDGALVQDSELNSIGAYGIEIVGSVGGGEVRRNVLSRITDAGVYVNSYYHQQIHHNLFLDSTKGVMVYRDSSADVRYNTFNNISQYGIEFNYDSSDTSLNSARYNIFSNITDGASGAVAIYGSSNVTAEGNALFNVDNQFAGTVVTSTAPDPLNLTLDPVYISAGSLVADAIPTAGLYDLPASGVDFTLDSGSPYLYHSEFGSQAGAYNLVDEITSVNPLQSVSTRHDHAYLKNGEILGGSIRLAAPVSNNNQLTVDFSAVDSGFDPANIKLTDQTINNSLSTFWVSYPVTQDNAITSGSNKAYGLTVTADNGLSETIQFNPWNLDNAPPTVTVTGINEGDTITTATTANVTISDAAIGGYQLEYSLDGGTNWINGDSHLVLESGGINDANAAALRVDGVNAMVSAPGINIVELTAETFNVVPGSAQVFATDNLEALVAYLNGLADDTIIAIAVKGNGRSGNSTTDFNVNNALIDFGFNTAWTTNDSYVAIGYKGVRSAFSYSEYKTSGTGIPLTVNLSELASGAMMNTAITLPVDETGAKSLMVRGIDFLGNVSAATTINYTVQ
jgi:hypothetical protein